MPKRTKRSAKAEPERPSTGALALAVLMHYPRQSVATVMAMLECYAPSPVAWRVLSRVADAFMTVDEEDAISVMRRLARPAPGDPGIVAGESGGVGLAGLLKAVADPAVKAALSIDEHSRIFLVNTEGATDPDKYEEIVGRSPAAVASGDVDGRHA